MKPTSEIDIKLIEARARAMRAQAVLDGSRAIKRWFAARLAVLRPAQTRARHG